MMLLHCVMPPHSHAEINNQLGPSCPHMALLCTCPPTEVGSFISSSTTPFLGTPFHIPPATGNCNCANRRPCEAPPKISRSLIFGREKTEPKRPTSRPNQRRSCACAAVYSSNECPSKSPENAGSVLSGQLPHNSLPVDEEDKSQQSNGFCIRKTAPALDLRVDLEVVQRTFLSQSQATDTSIPVDIKRVVTKFQLAQTYRESPTSSPKEDLSQKWREYQGCANWEGLLNPLDANLRREIVKYGEFAQATYDAFDFDSHSKYCGSCRFNRHALFGKVGLRVTGYEVTKYLYATSNVHLPKWFGCSDWMDPWSKDSNWMGYVAVCTEENEVRRLGRRDILIAWRGTVTQLEWMENLNDFLHPLGDVDGDAVKVERGFLSIYTSKRDRTRYNKQSASEQVMDEVRRLVEMYDDRDRQELSITITGHSLGGALALLNAYEIASKVTNKRNIPGLRESATLLSETN